MAWTVRTTREDLQTLLEAGFILRAAGRLDDAQVVFQGVQALSPNLSVAEVALGTVDFERGDFARARKRYERVIEANPRDAWAYAQLGETELFDRRYAEAKTALDKAVELDPKGPQGALARRLLKLLEEVRAAAGA
ncbi:MAG: tetratricopeptide repeat protein [Acidobacteria bacterium]|nr:tetratricopeptide repeat protein [Acidobacteriota bacterium]